MPDTEIVVRDCRPGDLAVVQAIYAHHVLHGVASFEEVPPDLEQIRERHARVRAHGLPYLVALLAGRVGGYAYALPYRPRSAYRYSVENTVYVDPERTGRGLGRALMGTLVDRCTAAGLRQMIAVIGDSGNAASIGLHASLGFARVALLPAVGFKHGRWVDSVMMQRALGPGDGTPPDMA